MSELIVIKEDVKVIGVFSDLHADDMLLSELINSNPNVDQWFSAGDNLDMFKPMHYNKPTLRKLIHYNIKSVYGNHEKHFIDNKIYLKKFRDEENLLKFLVEMPFEIKFLFGEKKVSIFHATPLHFDQYVKEINHENFKEYFSEISSDFIFVGHTHKFFIKEFDHQTIVNPGSISEEGTYILLVKDEDKIKLIKKKINLLEH